ncbi:hypothetical protein LA52FAK_34850 [Desulforhopalus sp. 52FAK]
MCKRAEKEQKGVIISFQETGRDSSEPPRSVHIALPIHLTSNSLLISAFELQPRDKQQLHQAMQQLEWGLQWLKEEITTTPTAVAKVTGSTYTNELLSSLQNQPSLAKATTLLTDKLVSLFDCLRVSIGRYQNQQVSVLAISHQSTIERTSPVVTDIIEAMEECVDQDVEVIYPDSGTCHGPITHQHQLLSAKHGAQQIISFPISSAHQEEKFVVTLEQKNLQQIGESELQSLRQLIISIGPLLNNLSLSEQPLLTVGRRRIKHKLQGFKDNKIAATIKAAVPLLILLIIFFGRGDFRIEADVTLSGTILRTIVAPFPGYVAEANKSAGDHVAEGEILASLDTSDLTLDELSWKSKYSQADLEYRKAIADNATSLAKIINQQKKQAEIQLSLLQLQKQRAEIRAPFTGTLVTGDLSQAIGGPVERGKMLFEMIPDGGFTVLAQVDEKDISLIQHGQSGVVVFNSLPKETFSFTVTKITPKATAKDGTNSFRVEASLEETAKRLSPGMTGYGKIGVGRKPYIWLWTRSLMNKLRLLGWNMRP